MAKRIIKISLLLLLFIITITCSQITAAKQTKKNNKAFLSLRTSLLTHHWNNNSDYNNSQELIGLEYHSPNSNLYGLIHFKNSYSQPCWYIYTGKSYNLKQISYFKIYWKLTYGIITGYDDEDGRYNSYLNRIGTFPVIIPSICIKYDKLSLEASLLANAGFIITTGIQF
ncbi:hypothetical protein [Sporohalobacter salinus]|uniref:hypothetical protein n=1 Tax=Sporohalobacter salinus TaxID=1494606 RepID=UPI00196120DA|nr:hypothetical protein [Sporohalobacter salinus]MBM7623264.1 hypothetical protein [Sporohalobacter salinus]